MSADWDDAKIKAANFNSRALNALFSVVTNKEFKKKSSTETAKEKWTILQITYEGTKAIKDSKIQRLVGKIDVRSGKKNGSTSLENDNMCYVSFRTREQECVPWCGEIQNQRSEVLGKTFNLHSNST